MQKDKLTIIVETPRGSRNKYNHDETTNTIYLKKILPEGMYFPFDFGSVPGTLAADGDPLDVILLTDEPVAPGCRVACRLIGAITAQQTQNGATIRNDRLIAVADASHQYASIEDIRDIDARLLEAWEQFFVNYNRPKGKLFEPQERVGASEAWRLVEAATKNERPG